jgi:hypothetical protein
MATSNKIFRLAERIEALGNRRAWLTTENLTDDAIAKLRAIVEAKQAASEQVETRSPCAHWSTNALLCFLINAGVLSSVDFIRRSS